MDEYSFSLVENQLDSLTTSESKSLLLQWNLDTSLIIRKYRFTGRLPQNANTDEYHKLVKEFFLSPEHSSLATRGQLSGSGDLVLENLQTTITNTEFLNKLEENGITAPSGTIRGCYEELFHGVAAGDLLRELLLNPDSENSHVFAESEKSELFFKIFRLFVIGGSMCQPESSIDRSTIVMNVAYVDAALMHS